MYAHTHTHTRTNTQTHQHTVYTHAHTCTHTHTQVIRITPYDSESMSRWSFGHVPFPGPCPEISADYGHQDVPSFTISQSLGIILLAFVPRRDISRPAAPFWAFCQVFARSDVLNVRFGEI